MMFISHTAVRGSAVTAGVPSEPLWYTVPLVIEGHHIDLCVFFVQYPVRYEEMVLTEEWKMKCSAFFLFVASLVFAPIVSTYSAEDLISQLERCESADGFVGSLYSVSPGDMGLGYNIKFRVVNGQGFFARDHFPKTEKSTLVWSEWRQVPRVMATKEGRLRAELNRPTLMLLMDVSINGKGLSGSAEYPDEVDDKKPQPRPEKLKLSCVK